MNVLWVKNCNLSDLAFSGEVSIFFLLSSDFEVLYDNVEPWQANWPQQAVFAILMPLLGLWSFTKQQG